MGQARGLRPARRARRAGRRLGRRARANPRLGDGGRLSSCSRPVGSSPSWWSWSGPSPHPPGCSKPGSRSVRWAGGRSSPSSAMSLRRRRSRDLGVVRVDPADPASLEAPRRATEARDRGLRTSRAHPPGSALRSVASSSGSGQGGLGEVDRGAIAGPRAPGPSPSRSRTRRRRSAQAVPPGVPSRDPITSRSTCSASDVADRGAESARRALRAVSSAAIVAVAR